MGASADLYGRVERQDEGALRRFLERYVPDWRTRFWDDSVGGADDLIDRWLGIGQERIVLYASGRGVAPDVEFAMIAISAWNGRALGISIAAADAIFDSGYGSDVPPHAEAVLEELLAVLGASEGFCTVEEPPPTSEEEWAEAVNSWREYRPDWRYRWDLT